MIFCYICSYLCYSAILSIQPTSKQSYQFNSIHIHSVNSTPFSSTFFLRTKQKSEHPGAAGGNEFIPSYGSRTRKVSKKLDTNKPFSVIIFMYL